MYFLVFYLGMAVGTVFGIGVIAMCNVAKKADEYIEKQAIGGMSDEAKI